MNKKNEKISPLKEKKHKIDDLRDSVLEYIGEKKNIEKSVIENKNLPSTEDKNVKIEAKKENAQGKKDTVKRISANTLLKHPALNHSKAEQERTNESGCKIPKNKKNNEDKNRLIYCIRFLWVIALFLCLILLFIFYEINEVNKLKKIKYKISNKQEIHISNADYVKNFDALYKFYYQTDLITKKPSQDEIKKEVISKLTRDKILENLLMRNGIKIDEVKVDEFLKKLVYEKDESAEHVNSLIKLLFGWDIADYKQHIVRPMVLKDALQQWLADNDPQNKRIEDKATAVYKEILEKKEGKGGGDIFAQLALEYNEDKSVGLDGDLGYIRKGEMPKEFESKVFNMKLGEIELIKTKYGYHIVRINDKIEDVGNIVVKAQHILFKFDDPESFISKELAAKNYNVNVN